MTRPKYLIALKELHKRIFEKLDEHSYDLILRGSFISKFNALPSDTRSMYFQRITSVMQQNQATFDYFTGADKSEYNAHIDLNDLNQLTSCDQEQGKTILNAIFNYTDVDKSALVHDDDLNEMLKEFNYDETVDIAIGLGIEIPIENQEAFTLNTYKSEIIDGNVSAAIEDESSSNSTYVAFVEKRAASKSLKQEKIAKMKSEKQKKPQKEIIDGNGSVAIEDGSAQKRAASKALKHQKVVEMKSLQQQKLPKEKQSLSTKYIKLSEDTKAEYTKFKNDIRPEYDTILYKPFETTQKYTNNDSVNAFRNEMKILEQRQKDRTQNSYDRKQKIYGVMFAGFLAFIVATKIIGENWNGSQPKIIPPITLKNENVNKKQKVATTEQTEESSSKQSATDCSIQKISHIDTEITFPTDLAFGANLLKEIKKDYVVSQYVVKSDDNQK